MTGTCTTASGQLVGYCVALHAEEKLGVLWRKLWGRQHGLQDRGFRCGRHLHCLVSWEGHFRFRYYRLTCCSRSDDILKMHIHSVMHLHPLASKHSCFHMHMCTHTALHFKPAWARSAMRNTMCSEQEGRGNSVSQLKSSNNSPHQ